MPYKNIHFIKLMLELFDDNRFIQECSDSQKLDYILWMAMAGLTQNEAKNDPKWFKTRFNLSKNIPEITENLDFLIKTFPKMVSKNGIVKFKNFKKLHNPLRNAEGTPKDSQRNAQNRIDKNRIDKIIEEYQKKQGWELSKEQLSVLYGRLAKSSKDLLLMTNKDLDYAVRCLKWVADTMKNKALSWTLETVVSHCPEFMSKYPMPDNTPKEVKNLIEGIIK